METKNAFQRNWKLYTGALLLAFCAALIGPINIPLKIGSITFSPSIFAIIGGGLLGPDLIKLFNEEESRKAASNVLFALAPFMAKMGISAGANLSKLVDVGPALLLQEFGNVGTILLSLPLALLLGLKKEAIGACHSIDRDSSVALVTDIYGPDAPETKGTFAVYITGSVIGTLFISIFVSVVASWNVFHPLALGMACGVGSANMMSVATSTLAEIYPTFAEEIVMLGGVSDMLTGVTGLYMGMFVALPLCTFLYNRLEPIFSRLHRRNAKLCKEGESS